MTTAISLFLLFGLLASASANEDLKMFGKSLTAQARKLAGHDSGDMAWAAPCMAHCPKLTDLMALQSLGESPTWAEVKEVGCGDNLETIKCVIDKCGADAALKKDATFQGILSVLTPIACGCACDEVGQIVVDGMPKLESDVNAAADKICPIMPAGMKCGEGEATCAGMAESPLVGAMEAMCLMKKHDCKLEGDGSFEKCTGNTEMEKCNGGAVTGSVDASCCAVGKTATDCMGKPECMQIALGYMMTQDASGTYKKAVDAWNEACPDEIPSAADIEKKLEEPLVDPESSSSDWAMPKSLQSGSFFLGPLSLFALLALLLR